MVDTLKVPSLDSSYNVYENLPNRAYDSLLSHKWRVTRASDAIDFIVKNKVVKSSKVIVMGYSEGGQVAPAVAVRNKYVTHLVCIAGGGLNQFFDMIINERMKEAKGEVSPEEAQLNIDNYLIDVSRIYQSPLSVDSTWQGHTYLRWSSFSAYIPLDDFKKLRIPVLLVYGSNDRNSEALTYDYVQLEALRLGKTNFTVLNYPGYDHYFSKSAIINGTEKQDWRIEEMYKKVFAWLNK